MQTQRLKPKHLRPKIKPPVSDRFWEYCQQHHLFMDATVTAVIAAWLEEQDQSTGKAA